MKHRSVEKQAASRANGLEQAARQTQGATPTHNSTPHHSQPQEPLSKSKAQGRPQSQYTQNGTGKAHPGGGIPTGGDTHTHNNTGQAEKQSPPHPLSQSSPVLVFRRRAGRGHHALNDLLHIDREPPAESPLSKPNLTYEGTFRCTACGLSLIHISEPTRPY